VKWCIVISSLTGALSMIYLVWLIGFQTVFTGISRAGFWGMGLLCAYSLIVFVILSAAWICLLPRNRRASPSRFYLARLVRDSIAEITPLSPIVGMFAAARLMAVSGMDASYAAASVTADATTETMAQAAFLALGLALGASHFHNSSGIESLSGIMLAALFLAIPCIAGSIALQKMGADWAQRMIGRFLPHAGEGATFRQAIDNIYESRSRLAGAAALHLLGWILSAGGTFIAFRLVGSHISFSDALALEALLCILRSLAAFVPAAIGVQEAGYAALGPMFGASVEMSLAVSLLKRAREIVTGIPALIYWQLAEGRRALAGGHG
jgi:putative membrane protein